MEYQMITEFNLNSKEFKSITDFVSTDTTSPYLEQARKIKPVEVAKKVLSAGNNKPNAFASIAAKKGGDDTATDEAKLESSEGLNDSLDEMSQEDYQDVGELAIEFLDFAIDKLFIFLGRNPEKNNALAASKKKRLKIVIGKLMQKHEVKLSMEFIAVVLFGSYINAKWASSKKIDKDSETAETKPKKGKTKVIDISKAKAKKEVKKEVKKASPPMKGGLVNL